MGRSRSPERKRGRTSETNGSSESNSKRSSSDRRSDSNSKPRERSERSRPTKDDESRERSSRDRSSSKRSSRRVRKSSSSRRRHRSSSSSSSGSSDSSSSSGSSSDDRSRKKKRSKSRKHHKISSKKSHKQPKDKKEKKVKKNKRSALAIEMDERASRRVAKKQAKLAATMLGYSNTDNRFGDSDLARPFVWGKKEEKDGGVAKSAQQREVQAIDKIDEIRKVKERRETREQEQEEQERLKDEEDMLRQRIEYADMEADMEVRDQKQLVHASTIRISEGREQPIDVLAKNLLIYHEYKYGTEKGPDGKAVSSLGKHINMSVGDPCDVFDGLDTRELKKLQTEINGHLALAEKKENEPMGVVFWKALGMVADDMVRQLSEDESAADLKNYYGGTANAGSEEAIHGNVKSQVDDMMRGKNKKELEALKQQVETRLGGGEAAAAAAALAAGSGGGGESNFWGKVLMRVTVEVAKAELRQVNRKVVIAGMDMMKKSKEEERMRRLNGEEEEDDHGRKVGGYGQGDASAKAANARNYGVDERYERKQVAGGNDEGDEYDARGADGSASPILAPFPEDEEDDYDLQGLATSSQGVVVSAGGDGDSGDGDNEIVDESDDRIELEEQRQLVESRRSVTTTTTKKPTAGQKLGEGESSMGQGSEVQVALKKYSWSDKYRPRKPRYFNRVKTGYDWNKYNQTHYDHDNPPPKVVQGYKFNIFYPDLIDRSKPPKFWLEKADTKDFAILHFSAGPPYEDIAFKIVNQEWSTKRQHGFKCSFDRGILHLYFGFKRHRYRR